MDLRGKKIIFLGDSITEGVGASATDKRYTDLVAQKTGAIVYNHGVSGTRIAKQKKPSLDPVCDRDFCIRARDMEKDADVIVVFGGTNDYGHGDAELGTFSDRTNDTFYGALHTLYTYLCENYPKAQKVIMTPLHRVNEESLLCDHNSVVPVAPLKTYVKIIREVAEYYSYPVLDMFKVSGIQPNIPANSEAYTVDGLHPNDAGYELISELVIKFLKTL
ncbi:MAG: SGNH/GDSL hydrolase family protein [Clostridia bacterium]|nr:SGNH/GDSL hydrolase family protein [Clostridia bacterium]MBQ8303718.1 SGNH/GDSL hydrolase family protein [Clostridia bacterium]